MRTVREIGRLSAAGLEKATRQMSEIKNGEVVCVHINNKKVLCVYNPNEPDCKRCILNDYTLCIRWVGESTSCGLIPVEDVVE